MSLSSSKLLAAIQLQFFPFPPSYSYFFGILIKAWACFPWHSGLSCSFSKLPTPSSVLVCHTAASHPPLLNAPFFLDLNSQIRASLFLFFFFFLAEIYILFGFFFFKLIKLLSPQFLDSFINKTKSPKEGTPILLVTMWYSDHQNKRLLVPLCTTNDPLHLLVHTFPKTFPPQLSHEIWSYYALEAAWAGYQSRWWCKLR